MNYDVRFDLKINEHKKHETSKHKIQAKAEHKTKAFVT